MSANQWQKLTKKCKETLDLTKQGDDEEIEIVVMDKPKSVQEKKQDALGFWMKRVRQKNKTIEIDDNNTISAIQSNKLPLQLRKASVPITTHQKERERTNKEQVIDVQASAAKANVQKYKQTLFKSNDQKKVQTKPISKESQQLAKKRRFEQQFEIIQSLNQPRWKHQKEKRHQINKDRYPISSSHVQYDYPNIKPKQTQKFNEATWAEYQRGQELIRMKKKQKQKEQKQRQRLQRKRLQKQKKQKEQEQYSQLFNGMLGIQPNKKIKLDEFIPSNPPIVPIIAQAQAQRQEIKQIIAQQGEIVQIQQSIVISNQSPNGSGDSLIKKRGRFGLNDIIKPYESRAPQFINFILSHNYGRQVNLPQTKKIPEYFQDQKIYSKVFHYLITNQCLADVSRRLQTLQKSGKDPIEIIITDLKQVQDQTQIYMHEVGVIEQQFTLKSFSLSKYRLGVITTTKQYSPQFYGMRSHSEHFAQLVMLVTPQTKQELGKGVKAIGNFKCHELQMIMRRRKQNELYFHDLQKLSTHVREYIAVSNIQHSELAHIIFDPKILQNQMSSYVSQKDCLNPVLQHLRSIFNPIQWRSIREMALRQRGIVLLQGPPGTGKTSTLMGLVSAQYEYLKKSGDNRKIMICAPSNAAVDHIAKRLSTQGLFNGQGEIVKPTILRTGIVQSLDPAVRQVSLDDICQKRLLLEQKKQKEEGSLTTTQIKEKIIEIQKELKKAKGTKEYDAKKQEELRYESMLYTFRSKKVVTSRKFYNQIESQYLNNAQIILTTLSSSGNQKLDRLRGQIACLIIDQAAQATETNLLIALQSGVEKVLLIGDPYQLPATCFSSDCNVTLFNRSLFQRFLDANIKPYFLNIQYRMAPMIRYFPSFKFYHNRLIDSKSIIQRQEPPFLQCFKGRNVIFIDIKYSRETKKNDSYANQAEGKAVGLLIRCLLDPSVSMGVITPYQSQRKTIKFQCSNELKKNAEEMKVFESEVMVNTVDSFQGQEKDIILVSTVRANHHQNLGFLTDQRRINVTLTRSKYVLIVVGHGDTLGSNEVWNGFLEWTEKNKVYYEVNRPQDLKDTLKNVFTSHNEKKIRRVRYNQFTTDVRKKHRNQIQQDDFKVKKSPEKVSIPERSPPSQHQKQPHQRSKYALDINQSQKIMQMKHQKQQQMIDFQQLHLRMQKMEQQLSKRGYKQLFS